MAVLDKRLLLADLEDKLNAYIPANTVRQIINDTGEVLTGYEVTALPPDDGGGGDRETQQLIRMFADAKAIEGKSPKTIERYSYCLNRLFEAVKTPAKKITVYHLRQYMMSEKDRGISMNTIKGNSHIYSAFFGWLHAEGIIPVNPTVNIGVIKGDPTEEIPFTGEEIHRLKEAAENELQSAVIHFLLATGCRVSEMCAVNRGDVDYQNLRLEVLGKGNKRRTVYIDDVTDLLLKRYLSTRTDMEQELFRSRRGRFQPGGIRAMLKRIEERSHVPNVHPHRFRHTLATNLIDRGMSIQEVAAILGHSKLDTTMTYVYVNQRNTENSYRRYACM